MYIHKKDYIISMYKQNKVYPAYHTRKPVHSKFLINVVFRPGGFMICFYSSACEYRTIKADQWLKTYI